VPPTVVVAVVAALLAALALWLVGVVNGLLRLRGLVQQSWQQIEDELRGRHDLVPDLVALVRRSGPASGEAAGEAAGALTRACGHAVATAVSRDPLPARADAERGLTAALGRLFAAADGGAVRSDESYLALRRELTDRQARIAAARRLHDANVVRLDARIADLPARLVARLVGVRPAEPFGPVTDAVAVTPQAADLE
jgi:LemA protein